MTDEDKLLELKNLITKHMENHKKLHEEGREKINEATKEIMKENQDKLNAGRDAFVEDMRKVFDADIKDGEELKVIDGYIDTLGFAVLEVFTNTNNPNVPPEVQKATAEAQKNGQSVEVQEVKSA